MGTKERLEKVFQHVFKDKNIRISNTATAEAYPGWTPVTHAHVMEEIQREFQVKISDDEMSEMKNMGDFVKVIDKKLSEKKR
ncbi:hypothetical protein FACS189418_3190 [Clostridia bacterium]|nr:hypothetical protein FACS189418_3190 [Clostridia bacterium]